MAAGRAFFLPSGNEMADFPHAGTPLRILPEPCGTIRSSACPDPVRGSGEVPQADRLNGLGMAPWNYPGRLRLLQATHVRVESPVL
jgi:hypothetical protein